MTHMPKCDWKDPGGKVTIMLGCVALIAAMVFIDGLMKGEFLRALAGFVVAAPFATFMVRGIPIPVETARRVEREMEKVTSLRPGATSDVFRWCMAGLGVLLGLGALLGAGMFLVASTETIEIFIPAAARDIRGAEAGDSEMLDRLVYAALFAVAAWAALLTAWKRARG